MITKQKDDKVLVCVCVYKRLNYINWFKNFTQWTLLSLANLVLDSHSCIQILAANLAKVHATQAWHSRQVEKWQTSVWTGMYGHKITS